jgi:hypothetical protein
MHLTRGAALAILRILSATNRSYLGIIFRITIDI